MKRGPESAWPPGQHGIPTTSRSPAAQSHRMTWRSSLPVSRSSPVGLKWTVLTHPWWPSSSLSSFRRCSRLVLEDRAPRRDRTGALPVSRSLNARIAVDHAEGALAPVAHLPRRCGRRVIQSRVGCCTGTWQILRASTISKIGIAACPEGL